MPRQKKRLSLTPEERQEILDKEGWEGYFLKLCDYVKEANIEGTERSLARFQLALDLKNAAARKLAYKWLYIWEHERAAGRDPEEILKNLK